MAEGQQGRNRPGTVSGGVIEVDLDGAVVVYDGEEEEEEAECATGSLSLLDQGEVDRGPSAEAKRMAAAIMKQADRHNHNGELTVNEMRTFLHGTEYQTFSDWLSAPHTRDRHWKAHDRDMSGTMDLGELEKAVDEYLRDVTEGEEEAMEEEEEEARQATRWEPGRGGSWTASIMQSIQDDVEEIQGTVPANKVATPRQWRQLGVIS